MAWDRSAVINLRELLARLYPTERDARRVVVDAGLDPAFIAFDPKAINNWFAILEEARNRPGKIEAIIAVARAEYPEEPGLELASRGTPPPVLAGPEPTDWQGPKGPAQLERIIGTESSLVPISHLEKGLVKARAVAKIRRSDGGAGSGFLAAGGILVTNNHVLPDAAAAQAAVVLFNYQLTLDGLTAEVDERRLLPDEFFKTSKEDDWTGVRVAGDPQERWGFLPLAPAAVAAGDRVNIIQHPSGLPKQISLYSNVVAFVGGKRVQYLTDTEPGSSGSPVFDRDWNVVALHHSGGWISEPGDTAPNREFYRNEGIDIVTVIDGLGL